MYTHYKYAETACSPCHPTPCCCGTCFTKATQAYSKPAHALSWPTHSVQHLLYLVHGLCNAKYILFLLQGQQHRLQAVPGSRLVQS
jgi:hypothetical protein